MASNTTARLTLFCWTAVLLDREVDSPPHPPQDRIRPVTTDSPRNLSCAGRAGRPRDASPGCARPRAQGPLTPSKTADQTLAPWARLREGPGRWLLADSDVEPLQPLRPLPDACCHRHSRCSRCIASHSRCSRYMTSRSRCSRCIASHSRCSRCVGVGGSGLGVGED